MFEEPYWKQLPHQQIPYQQLPHQQIPYQQLLHQQIPLQKIIHVSFFTSNIGIWTQAYLQLKSQKRIPVIKDQVSICDADVHCALGENWFMIQMLCE